jgi:serine O-acetyltransferase
MATDARILRDPMAPVSVRLVRARQLIATPALTADLRHMTATWEGGGLRVWMAALPRLLVQGRFRTVVYYRVGSWLFQRRAIPLALWLQSRGQRASGAEIHPAARIGPGFNLVHGGGVVIGHDVVAGRDLVVYQGVTLGHGSDAAGQPHLGDGVRLFAQATVLGAVRMGDGSKAGAKALVLADVPAGEQVIGIWGRSAAAEPTR